MSRRVSCVLTARGIGAALLLFAYSSGWSGCTPVVERPPLSAVSDGAEGPPPAPAEPAPAEPAAAPAAERELPASCAAPNPARAALDASLLEPVELIGQGGFEDAARLPVPPVAAGRRAAEAARTGKWGWALPAGEQLLVPFVPEKGGPLSLSAWVRGDGAPVRARISLGGPPRGAGARPAGGGPRQGGEWVEVGTGWTQLTLEEPVVRSTPAAFLTVEATGPLLVDDLSVTTTILRRAEGVRAAGAVQVPEEPAAPFLFAVLLHVEDEPGLSDGGPRWEDATVAIETLAAALQRHGGALTVQTELNWLQGAAAASGGQARVATLAKRGVHFSSHTHGPVCVDPSGTPQSASACKRNPSWPPARDEALTLAYVRERQRAIESATGVFPTDHNGNFDLGSYAGLGSIGVRTLSAFKSRTEQSGLPALYTNPWRPAGADTDAGLTAFLRHDPTGPVVYLPGASVGWNTDLSALPDRMTRLLGQTLRFADPERVNTTYIVLPLSAFTRGGPAARTAVAGGADENLAALERALSTVVDPLVAQGYLRWASLPEMGEAFLAWERACEGSAGAGASATEPTPTVDDPCPEGCLNFVVNVHDVTHASESADTLLRLVDIYTKYSVRGEFYMTAPVVEAYLQTRPDVIARLKTTGMTISYHTRPPHPLSPGFDGPLQGLEGAALEARIRDYETWRQDPETGALDRSRPGGYALVAEAFERPPVTVSVLHPDPRVKSAAYKVYRELGARAVVWYHEAGAPLQAPLEMREGLLARPSDFSVTRWAASSGGRPQFWWNRVARDTAYKPADWLERQVRAWSGPRGPFITAIIHDNDLSRLGNAGFTTIYFEGGDKSAPRAPPWDLDQPDRTRLRDSAERALIWSEYERLVAWAASNLRVVTAAELTELPRQAP